MFGRLKPEKTGTRSIDGMRDAHMPEAGAVMLDATDLPWIEEDGGQTKAPVDAEKAKALEQQNKIIAFFSIDASSLVTPEEIVGLGSRALRDLKRKRLQELRRMTLETENPEVTPKQRTEFLRKLAQGDITNVDEANFLLMIRDPLNNPKIGAEKMFEQVSADPRQVQILAVAAGYNLKNWQKVDSEALYRLLGAAQTNGADYRTPVGFAKLRRYFLNGIRAKAKEQVYQCYVQSLKELERTLYGERFEYYRQFAKLRREAQTSEVPIKSESKIDVRKTKIEKPVTRTMREKWSRILSERSGEMLGRAVIEGDAWRGDGKEEYLGTHDLAEVKLSPMYEVKVAEGKVCLSKLFQLGDGQVGVIAYVPEGRSFKVRSFYRNNALGLWCYLPDYVMNKSGAVERYNTGWSQESVILPFELQTALMQIENKFGVVDVPRADFVFNGTAQACASTQEKLRGDFYREVSREAINHDFAIGERRRKKAPYTLGIDYRRAPDFGQMRAKFVTNTADAGVTEVEGFSSHDGQLVWWFGNDNKKRTWVMHVEAVSPLTSLGLRRDWTAMGDFVTPLYEYSTKAGIYGDRDDTKGAKQCMWNNYLSNVPLIQDYVAQRD